ncbi:UV radiation resistance protein and autophagy-related subunit 14-domain-containing protein [Cristinia sonorae]|uniref:Autophagy-related protein 14 n=1 Tax=Cristinia sonorae TaxID=1940300 RepID=A0A8K0UIX1_9AGAR|nr:UV radiation resistance protein and autophagy-related subunit 14-domain-containing protein [Cristinia sonorae]
MSSVECQNCELKQRQFFCESCVKQHISAFRIQYAHAAADRDAHIASAQRALANGVEPARLRRADLKGREDRVREIWEGLEAVRKVNEKNRESIKALRESLANRRRNLAIASSTASLSRPHSSSASPPIPPSSTSPPSLHTHMSNLSSNRALQTRRFSSTSPHTPSPIPSRPLSSAQHYSSTPPSRPTIITMSSSPQPPRFTPTSPRPIAAHSSSRVTSGTFTSNEKGSDALSQKIEEAQYRLSLLAETLTRARAGLVQELVEVFSVVEVGGRPPIGGKAGTKGEWTIGGLVLPVPGDMRRYPPDHINTVLTHTLHFLSLLAFYLGVRLPFDVIWSRSSTPPSSGSASSSTSSVSRNGLLGVGTPWIGAIRGGEHGGWARWSTKHPLHVSSAPPASSPNSPTSPSTPTRSTSSRPSSQPRSVSSPAQVTTSTSASTMADSAYEEEPTSTSASGSSFTTALAMLLYDVCYLAHTQAVDVPLAQAGEVLGNLWAVCCSPELGRKSHATYPYLPAPTPSNFNLDFAQLLQATAANPSRARIRGAILGRGKSSAPREKIIEEEDGWDLVEMDGLR